MRLDLFLVESQLADSRTEAQDLIEGGFVFAKKNTEPEVCLKKPSYKVNEIEKENIYIKENNIQKFVSRGGLKLEAALKHLDIKTLKGFQVLDVGQSTGGFTDCLLSLGAEKIVGIDVGHAQLHSKLKNNSRVVSLEKMNAKDLESDVRVAQVFPKDKFDFIVMDVSFISIEKIIPHLKNFLKKDKFYLFLVKPQFECSKDFLNKNGVVTNTQIYLEIESRIRNVCIETFGNVEDFFSSELAGKDGNKEFFIYGKNSI